MAQVCRDESNSGLCYCGQVGRGNVWDSIHITINGRYLIQGPISTPVPAMSQARLLILADTFGSVKKTRPGREEAVEVVVEGGSFLPPPLGTHSREHRQMRERNMRANGHGPNGGGHRGGPPPRMGDFPPKPPVAPPPSNGNSEFLPYS
ncbi:hypothetical protein BDV93DRAFT_261769 [Ceratobasidium sp. AG-I]|nr:hypothetical protein BDV93DRAFT_261769 [Ceratobasidium sp. AG-I]